jgi:hypothetical protein
MENQKSQNSDASRKQEPNDQTPLPEIVNNQNELNDEEKKDVSMDEERKDVSKEEAPKSLLKDGEAHRSKLTGMNKYRPDDQYGQNSVK